MVKRYIWLLIGYLLVALGVSMMVHVSSVGLEPWVAVNVGLTHHAMSIGFWDGIIKAFFILIVVMGEKRFPPVGTLLNLVIISPMIDFFIWLIPYPPVSFFLGNYLFFVLGIMVSSIGGSMAIASDLGAGPKTQFLVLIEQKTKFRLSHIKYGFEMMGLILALGLGGPIFIGTILFVFFSGFFWELFVPRFRKMIVVPS